MWKADIWGATPDDWAHFDVILGLGEDLLPVVSKITAKISDKSTIKSLGKTPSLYNKAGEVVGIADWTQRRASARDLDKWSKNEDYGICLQTRNVRALDVDITDAAIAAAMELEITEAMPGAVIRYRSSSKFLIPFIISGAEGDYAKRVMPVGEERVEFLATGQQFVALGTHPSGEKYQWKRHEDIKTLRPVYTRIALPDGFPVLSAEEFEALWKRLVEHFATGEVAETGQRRSANASAAGVMPPEDDISAGLEALGLATGIGKEGRVYIECPFKAEHTDGGKDDSETGTAYFPAGGRGYEQGHFKCLHAHCAGRADHEFLEALGLSEPGGGFEDLGELQVDDKLESEDGSLIPLSGVCSKGELKRNEDGKTIALIENVTLILNNPSSCERDIRYDVFRDEIVYKKMKGTGNWTPFTDTDYTELRIYLANTGFLPISHEMMRQAVQLVAKKRMFDTAIEWINDLPPWDGVPRVKKFLSDVMGALPDERGSGAYNDAVSEYMWTAFAGRVLSPGCKADAAPIFVGEQFIGKTYAIMNMVPDMRYYCEINFEDKDDDLARKMRGKMVAEFAEMRGFQGRDSEGTKAFISRQFEEWTPKYMEFVTVYPRRLLFIGSYNGDEIFTDETGNRREFPVKVTRADIEGIKRDREQLWAEGKTMFLQKGIEFYYRKANDLADDIRAEFMVTDPWDDDVCRFLHEKGVDGNSPLDREFFTINDVMTNGLGVNTQNIKKYESMRIAKILKRYGCEKTVRREKSTITKVWRKKKR